MIVADFETTTNLDYTEVWLSAFKDVKKDKIYINDNIKDFLLI